MALEVWLAVGSLAAGAGALLSGIFAWRLHAVSRRHVDVAQLMVLMQRLQWMNEQAITGRTDLPVAEARRTLNEIHRLMENLGMRHLAVED